MTEPQPQGITPATSVRVRYQDPTVATTPAVTAHDIELVCEEGRVFGPLNLTIPSTGLTILTGRAGSGRTALALCLAGRMKLTRGTLNVLGHTKLSEINKIVAIAGVDEIDALDRELTIRTILGEHRAWSKRWLSWTTRADDDYYRSLCADVFGDRDLPPLDAYVAQISPLDRLLIRISLALAPASRTPIEMLVMDDLDQVVDADERALLVHLLTRIATRMPVVVNSQNPLPADTEGVTTHIELFTDGHHLQPEHTGLKTPAKEDK